MALDWKLFTQRPYIASLSLEEQTRLFYIANEKSIRYRSRSGTGTTGPTVGEALTMAGHKLRRADKNRIQGKIQVHERLKLNSKGRPRLQIFKSCPNLIRELQGIPVDTNKPEDVDTKAADHAYDALRYLIMSRPRSISSYEQMQQIKKWTPSDPTFGY